MGTFVLTQTQSGKNLYIYPNGDLSTCTEFAAVGDSPNYTCVDEDRLVPDEDDTYVWWNGIATALDLYELQDHTTEVGTINYIQVYARGKSHETAQHINGVYKIICSPDSTCSHVYKSDDKNLTTSYNLYSKVWVDNPLDSLPWAWADIDLLCAGVECSSPTIPGKTATLTIRPNGPGVQTNCTPFGDTPNWKCVDEETTDEDTTYNYNASGTGKIDLFALQNHNLEVGTITGVKFVVRARRTGASIAHGGTFWIYTNGSLWNSGAYYPSLAYQNFSNTRPTNPITSVAWTWADIDALQAGYSIWNNTTEERVTQFYVIVEYVTESSNPEIRTTQCYVKVNYDQDPVECTLNSPEHISTNHARNIKMLNFWNGTREVYDLNRSRKSIVLTGAELYTDACDRILCVRGMARNGAIISVSTLALDYFNGDYRIKSFGWNKISEKPEHYKWILELEDSEL